MSKFKIGDLVVLRDDNRAGVVVSRDAKVRDDKKVDIRYIVKFGDGIENYEEHTKRELFRVNLPPLSENEEKSTYPRKYYYEHRCFDGRTITMVGVVEKYKEHDADHAFVKGVGMLTIPTVNVFKSLSVGYAICHPEDEFDPKVGNGLASMRAEKNPLAVLISPFGGEFGEDFVLDILLSKAQFIEKNLEKFVD